MSNSASIDVSSDSDASASDWTDINGDSDENESEWTDISDESDASDSELADTSNNPNPGGLDLLDINSVFGIFKELSDIEKQTFRLVDDVLSFVLKLNGCEWETNNLVIDSPRTSMFATYIRVLELSKELHQFLQKCFLEEFKGESPTGKRLIFYIWLYNFVASEQFEWDSVCSLYAFVAELAFYCHRYGNRDLIELASVTLSICIMFYQIDNIKRKGGYSSMETFYKRFYQL